MKKSNLTLFVWVAIQPLAVLLNPPQIALAAGTPASSCVNGLLYRSGNFGEKTRTEISEQLASTVCNGVTTEQESSSVQSCVTSLLFSTGNFGDISRTQTGEATAGSICSISHNVPQSAVPSVQPGQVIIIPGSSIVRQSSPQQLATCVNEQMYKQQEVCVDPWGGIDEDCFYRGTGGRRTISAATGVTLEQAQSICGG